MNHFERLAIFTQIEAIEGQLKGLKSLIAASANQSTAAPSHKVTQIDSIDSPHELSDEDDEELSRTLDQARKEAAESVIHGMRKKAEAGFQTVWEETSKGLIDG